jgi:hypothetical protein
MLIVQHTKIAWDKKSRGAPYAARRAQIAKAFALPYASTKINQTENVLHYLYFVQLDAEIFERINSTDILNMNSEGRFKVGALEISEDGENYHVTYRYDWHNAMPVRNGFDYNRGGRVALIERAMTLPPDTYGRVLYNGRYVDSCTGEWYYNLDIINIINNKEASSTVFIEREPEIIYRQTAVLH